MEKLVFGLFRYDQIRKLLLRNGEPVALGSRATDLLDLLLARRGEVVGKSELIEAAWPGLAVEESNLSVQIANLRKALGPAPHGGEWIVTTQRSGYRFVLDPAGRDLAVLGRPGVALLPFFDLSGDTATPLASYLSQDITTALSRFRSLIVSARSSSAQLAGLDARTAARRLGVEYLVEGNFRSVGGRLRLSLQLIEGASGATLWADNLHMILIDGVGDTDELAGRSAAAIEAQVHLAEIGSAHRRKPESLEAYDYYLRARRLVQTSIEADNAVAFDLYLRAIKLQPENIEFLSGAAEAIHHRTSVGWQAISGATRELARELSRRGIDRVEGDASSLGLFGNAMVTSYEEDLGYAVNERAVKLNNNSVLALVSSGLSRVWNGEFDEGELQFRRAAELSAGEPNQRFAYQGFGKVAVAREDWSKALYWGQATHAVSPGISGGHQQRIAASAMLGRMDEARRYLEQYLLVAPGVTIRSIDAGQPFRNRAHIAPLLNALRLAGLPER